MTIQVPGGSPPSDYAIAAWVGGTGSFGRVMALTIQRTVIVSPGVFAGAAIGGVRGRKLAVTTILGSFLASVGISTIIGLTYWRQKRRR